MTDSEKRYFFRYLLAEFSPLDLGKGILSYFEWSDASHVIHRSEWVIFWNFQSFRNIRNFRIFRTFWNFNLTWTSKVYSLVLDTYWFILKATNARFARNVVEINVQCHFVCTSSANKKGWRSIYGWPGFSLYSTVTHWIFKWRWSYLISVLYRLILGSCVFLCSAISISTPPPYSWLEARTSLIFFGRRSKTAVVCIKPNVNKILIIRTLFKGFPVLHF